MQTKLKFLLVDDEPEVHQQLREVLSPHVPMARFVCATNGSEGLKKLSREKFDLVICDLKMPKMDGITLMQAIRQINADYRPRHLVVLSGNVGAYSIPIELRGITYLAKPIDQDRLISTVKGIFSPAVKTAAAAPQPAAPAQPAGPKVAAELVNPFLDSSTSVLSTVSGLPSERENISVRSEDAAWGELTAFSEIDCGSFRGTFMISFESTCFLAIAGTMMGESYPSLTPELHDVCAELANQILGAAKRVIGGKGSPLTAAIPAVTQGVGEAMGAPKAPRVAVRFKTPKGCYTVEVGFQPKLAA
jgi:CheY-like chemotaxis protein